MGILAPGNRKGCPFMFNPIVLPPPPADRPVITPRPGESLVFATFRQLDRFHGSGLTATDQTAIVSAEREQLRQALAECSRRCAALLIANRAHVATIRQLQQSLADVHELNASLQEQLEEATGNAASDADQAATIAVAFALHVESH